MAFFQMQGDPRSDFSNSLVSGAGNVNPLLQFFGPGVVPMNMNANDALAHETWNRPEALKGSSEVLAATMVNLIVDRDEWPTRYIMPYQRTENDKVVWSVLRFNRSVADPTPEQAPTRRLTVEKRDRMGYLIRRGLQFFVERGFWRRPEGIQLYAMHLNNLRTSVNETVHQSVIAALLTAKNHYKEWERRFGKPKKNIRECMDWERQRFAMTQKRERGWHDMTVLGMKVLDLERVVPNAYIVPTGFKTHEATTPPPNLEYSRSGDRIGAVLDQGEAAFDVYKGLRVFETRAYEADNIDEPINLLIRERQIGDFFVMWDFNAHIGNAEARTYRSDHRSIEIFSMQSNQFEKISLQDALDACMRFDDSGNLSHDHWRLAEEFSDLQVKVALRPTNGYVDMFVVETEQGGLRVIDVLGQQHENALTRDDLYRFGLLFSRQFGEELDDSAVIEAIELLSKSKLKDDDVAFIQELARSYAANSDYSGLEALLQEKVEENKKLSIASAIGSIDYIAALNTISDNTLEQLFGEEGKDAIKRIDAGLRSVLGELSLTFTPFSRFLLNDTSAGAAPEYVSASSKTEEQKRQSALYKLILEGAGVGLHNLYHVSGGAEETGTLVAEARYTGQSKYGDDAAAGFDDISDVVSAEDVRELNDVGKARGALVYKEVTVGDLVSKANTAARNQAMKAAEEMKAHAGSMSDLVMQGVFLEHGDQARAFLYGATHPESAWMKGVAAVVREYYREQGKKTTLPTVIEEIHRGVNGNVKKFVYAVGEVLVNLTADAGDGMINGDVRAIILHAIDHANAHVSGGSRLSGALAKAPSGTSSSPVSGGGDVHVVPTDVMMTARAYVNARALHEMTRLQAPGTEEPMSNTPGNLQRVANLDARANIEHLQAAQSKHTGRSGGDDGRRGGSKRKYAEAMIGGIEYTDEEIYQAERDVAIATGLDSPINRELKARWMQVSRFAHPMIRLGAQLLLLQPPTKQFFKSCLDLNLMFPADMLLMRPFRRYNMGSAILCRGGPRLGVTWFGGEDFMMEDNAQTKTHTGNYTFMHASIVQDEREYLILEDVFCTGYIGGEGIDMFTEPSDFMPADYEYHRSIFAMMCPYGSLRPKSNNPFGRLDTLVPLGGRWDPTRFVGQLTKGHEEDWNKMRHPGAFYYNLVWQFERLNTGVDLNSFEFLDGSQLQNVACFQGKQNYYDPATMKFSQHTLNTGCWGSEVYNGCGDDRVGMSQRFLEGKGDALTATN